MQEPETTLGVVIVGAGIGGLVLAHGLRGAGVAVTVLERDARPEDTGGYRLHLDPVATRALRDRIPPGSYQALLGSAAGPGSFRQFAVLDRRLRTVARLPRPADPDGDDLLIGRIPLRVLLSHGLEDVIRWGTTVVGTQVSDDGTVAALLSDGTVCSGDVLVAADGARSPIAANLAGGPTARRLQVSGLAGRTALTPALLRALPDELHRGPAFAAGPGHGLLFLSAHDPGTAPVGPQSCSDPAPVREDPYLLWGFTIPGTERGNRDRLDRARAIAGAWSPEVRALVEPAEAAQVTEYAYYAADLRRPLAPWAAGPITALGDAVHPMPPTGGRGAATAIRDADALAGRLVAAADGSVTPVTAVHEYERSLRDRAAAAVRESLGPLRAQRWLGAPAVALLGAAGSIRSHLPTRSGRARSTAGGGLFSSLKHRTVTLSA